MSLKLNHIRFDLPVKSQILLLYIKVKSFLKLPNLLVIYLKKSKSFPHFHSLLNEVKRAISNKMM